MARNFQILVLNQISQAGLKRLPAEQYTVGKDIGLVYLPLELARAGTALEVEILGERIGARVADLPLVDPKGEKLRA